MSYSFDAQAKDRAELGAKVHEQLTLVAQKQPSHVEVDDVHQTVVQLLGLCRNLDANEQYVASVSGSVWERADRAEEGLESVEAKVSISISRA